MAGEKGQFGGLFSSFGHSQLCLVGLGMRTGREEFVFSLPFLHTHEIDQSCNFELLVFLRASVSKSTHLGNSMCRSGHLG